MRDVTVEESKNRRNYQKPQLSNYKDGDSSITGISYGYGKTTLVSDSSRVMTFLDYGITNETLQKISKNNRIAEKLLLYM